MSKEQARDEDAIARKMLERLQAVRFDPIFKDMLEVASTTQADLDALIVPQWYEIREAMHRLDMMWDASAWDGTSVTVGGKLRMAGDFTGIVDGTGLEGMEIGHDNRGEFYVVKDKNLVCLGFRVDQQDDQELADYRPLVLALAPPESYDEDIDADSSLFMMYPDDIDSIEFSEGSSTGIEANLKYYFPGIFDKVVKSIPDGCASDRAVTQSLKRLTVRSDTPNFHGFDLLKSLNTYIYGRIDFDTMGYEIEYEGIIRGLSEEDEPIEIESSRKFEKISMGFICGIRMEESDEEDGVYRPSLVIATPIPDLYGEFEAYIVPAANLLRLRNLRPRTSLMGKVASLRFEYVEDVAKYFSGEGEMFTETLNDTDEQFSGITERMQHELPEIVAYDEQQGHYRVSIRSDLNRIAKDYDELLARAGTKTLSEDAYNDICVTMHDTLSHLTSLVPGDMLVTHGEMVVIDTVGPDQESIAIEAGEFLRGQFCGFAISEVPDEIMRITKGEAGFTARDVSILVKNVIYTDSDGEEHTDALQAAEIALPIARTGAPTIFKLLHESDDE